MLRLFFCVVFKEVVLERSWAFFAFQKHFYFLELCSKRLFWSEVERFFVSSISSPTGLLSLLFSSAAGLAPLVASTGHPPRAWYRSPPQPAWPRPASTAAWHRQQPPCRGPKSQRTASPCHQLGPGPCRLLKLSTSMASGSRTSKGEAVQFRGAGRGVRRKGAGCRPGSQTAREVEGARERASDGYIEGAVHDRVQLPEQRVRGMETSYEALRSCDCKQEAHDAAGDNIAAEAKA